ncbi:arylamine N-acetyltransferase [Streptomyces sp. NBC_01210]|uniref:arylamine N-acetyltransferase family protein n=1 Tax=Streptomyces sp. NBC_01210 TaxID=2903774 RepID=UPI002E15A081|nr:arylamine N-acetyltransferase [Streptomyces sp. NBC_01210]
MTTETAWSSGELDLAAYLRRTGCTEYREGAKPDLATLRAVHRAHAAAIAFEDLDIVLGRPIPLDIASLQAKLVGLRRGGYCYEQNLLFAAVLERIGFAVTGLGARVRMGEAKLRPVTHMTLRVEADGEPWLCDVGFGGEGLWEPIPLRDGVEVRQGGWTFAIAREDNGVRALRSLHPDGWFDLYGFTLEERFPVDYAVMNHYMSTHPRSPFIARAVVQQTGEGVRHSLTGTRLSTARPDAPETERQVPAGELPEMLADVFGIELDAEESAELIRVHSARE